MLKRLLAAAAAAGSAVLLAGFPTTSAHSASRPRTAAEARRMTAAAWSIERTPNARARTGLLMSGTCTTAGSCTAVGSHVTASGIGVTLAERSDGTAWRVLPSPEPATAVASVLNGVSCLTRSACIAVGGWVNSAGTERTLVERWDGTRWHIVSTPNPIGSRQTSLNSVTCLSSASCTAVGARMTRSGSQVMLAERWNGSRWYMQAVPQLSGAHFAALTGIDCTTPSECTAVGQSDIGAVAERWNGVSWRIQRTPSSSHAFLQGVVCTARASCTAVGGTNGATLVERWNGTRWRMQHTPNPTGHQFAFLSGVDCSSRSRCTAVGASNTDVGDFMPLALRWNGTRWRIQHTPSPGGAQGNFLFAVACPTRSTCSAFGFSHGANTPLAMAQRWNGTAWQSQHPRNPVGAGESTLNAVACTSTTACIGVGAGAGATMAQRWTAGRWRVMRIPPVRGASLDAMSCLSSTACSAVGGSDRGVVAEAWDGTRWHIQPIPTPAGAHGAGLGGISCLSNSFCIATGAYTTSASPSGPAKPLAERWNGHSWTILPITGPAGAVQTFLGPVSCTSPSACTSTGEQHDAAGIVRTVAERWNGTSWQVQPTPNPTGVQFASLSGLTCTGPTACLAVGSSDHGALAERWNGTAWHLQSMPNPPGTQLTAVSCSSPAACTAIGFGFTDLGGTLVAERWNGTNWRLQHTPLLPAAHDISTPAIACPTDRTCIAVGGYENDGPGSITLAERWTSTDISIDSPTGPLRNAGTRAGQACVAQVLGDEPVHTGLLTVQIGNQCSRPVVTGLAARHDW